MKYIKNLTLLSLLLGIFILASCGDDDDNGIGADTDSSITGYWRLGLTEADSTYTGIIVHKDGTVSEWQYNVNNAGSPMKIGFKTGKWTVNGGHYELQLSKDNGDYYTVTVAGNNSEEMTLEYEGKTSVVPLYHDNNLPGQCREVLDDLQSMKSIYIETGDLFGYWQLQGSDGKMGMFVDNEGKVSVVYDVNYLVDGKSVGSKEVSYHDNAVHATDNATTFVFNGDTYQVYAVSDKKMYVSNDGENLKAFYKEETPKEVTNYYLYLSTPIDENLRGTWESTHVTNVVGGDTVIDRDISHDDEWAMQMYRRAVFSDNHKLAIYDQSYNCFLNQYFLYDDKTGTLTTSDNINHLLAPVNVDRRTFIISMPSSSELVMKDVTYQGSEEIFTYKKQ